MEILGLVLLVRPRVGVVRHHRGHPGRGRAAGRVCHQQQLDQVLLHRRDQRLDEEHVPLPVRNDLTASGFTVTTVPLTALGRREDSSSRYRIVLARRASTP